MVDAEEFQLKALLIEALPFATELMEWSSDCTASACELGPDQQCISCAARKWISRYERISQPPEGGTR